MQDDEPDKARIPLVIAENGQIMRRLMDCPEWLSRTGKNKRGNKIPAKEAKKRIAVESESDVDSDALNKRGSKVATKETQKWIAPSVESDVDSDELVRQFHQGQGTKRARYHADV